MKTRTLAAVSVVLVAALGGAAYRFVSTDAPPAAGAPPAPRQAAPETQKAAASDQAAASKTPKLYCQFYVFTEQRPRLGFYFDVAARDGRPSFQQIYIAESNGARTDYDGVGESRPEWRYDPAPEPKTIASTIMAPDTSQAGQHEEDIVIELYGYDPARTPNPTIEASLKNVHYQNLPGKCRQAAG